MKYPFSKSIYKYWRTDKYLWEEKRVIFWFIPYYKYSIWKDGKTTNKIRLAKYSKPTYIKKAIETKMYVDKKEFKEKYNSNKYLVPVNYEIQL
jgi:hypothetical protein